MAHGPPHRGVYLAKALLPLATNPPHDHNLQNSLIDTIQHNCVFGALGCISSPFFSIIFVGDPDKLTLVEKQYQGEEYLVLSHCWGTLTDQEKMRFCTTSENYGTRTRGFRLDEIPKTFQDAVLVTRALQEQYLWINALYIIQEGADCDWDSDANTMADIFACAYCTIYASLAGGWEDGFLKPQSDLPDIGVQGTPSAPTCTCDVSNDVDEGPLMKRAWVLQERVLSRRIIHFTAVHTYCECGGGVLCEQLTKLEP